MGTRKYKGNSDVSQVKHYKNIVKVGEIGASIFCADCVFRGSVLLIVGLVFYLNKNTSKNFIYANRINLNPGWSDFLDIY